jgi:Tol biopolymer transport system component
MYLLDGSSCEITLLLSETVQAIPEWDFMGQQIAYAKSDDPSSLYANVDIYVYDIRSGSERRITNTPSRLEGGPLWTSDGSLVFTAVDVDDIDRPGPDYDGMWPYDLVILPPGGQPGTIVEGIECLEAFTVAPSGREVAVQTGCIRDAKLTVIDTSTGEQTMVAANGNASAWAPDEDVLAYECYAGEQQPDQAAICLRSASGDVETLTVDLIQGITPAESNGPVINAVKPHWSADGSTLAVFGVKPNKPLSAVDGARCRLAVFPRSHRSRRLSHALVLR